MTADTTPVQRDDDHSLDVVPLRHPWHWFSGLVVLAVVAYVGYSFVTNPRIRWDLIGEYLGADAVLRGVLLTLELTVLAMVLGIVLGVVAAVMRLSQNVVLQAVAGAYVWLFRGTPVLVQLIFWFNIAALFPEFAIGVPFGPTLVSVEANTLITQFTAVAIGLGLNEGAYMSEIVRAGIISVGRGQSEAATALGMRRGTILRRVVLPQAMRVIIPPTGNETISMLKTTSLALVVGLPELLGSVANVYSRNYQVIPLLLVATIWYLVLSTVLSIGQYFLERRLARGSDQQPPETLTHRLARGLLLRSRRRSAPLAPVTSTAALTEDHR